MTKSRENAGKPVVAYVLDRFPELSQTFVRDEISELRRQGVQVVIISLRAPVDVVPGDWSPIVLSELPAGATAARALLKYLARRPRSTWRFCAAMASMRGAYSRLALRSLPFVIELFESAKVTRVHSHFAWGASAVGTYLAAAASVPFSLTLHAKDMYVHPSRLQAKLDRSDVPVTVCNFNREWLSENGYYAPGLVVVPCGVRLPAQRPRDPQNYILAVGRLIPKKGFDLLIEAFAQARDELGSLHMHIIGDGPERVRLGRLIRDRGLGQDVHLLGAKPHDEVLEHMNAALALALPCRVASDGDSDALPVVLREAMARSLPVITTPVAGIPELVDDTVGWVVPCDDSHSLARALTSAHTDREEAASRGQKARARIESKYTIEKTVGLLREHLLGHE